MAKKLEPTLRLADNSDVPAILSLLLTSFRSFPLFDLLYSPLQENKDYALDTIFFWGRRVKLAIGDSHSSVLVAEVPQDAAQSIASWKDRHEGNGEAWEMLEWARTRGRLEQAVPAKNTAIVGFTIWRWRDVAKLPEAAVSRHRQWSIVRSVQSSFLLAPSGPGEILTRMRRCRDQCGALDLWQVLHEERSISSEICGVLVVRG
jgi:hypothetical protein